SVEDRAFAFAVALFLNPSAESSRDRLLVPYAAKDLASTLAPERYESLRRVVTSARVTVRGFAKPVEKVVLEDFARIRIRARSLARHIGDCGVFEGFPVHRCYATLDRWEHEYASCERLSIAYFEYLDRILHFFLDALHLDLALLDLSESEYRLLLPYLTINLQLVRAANAAEWSDPELRTRIRGRMLGPSAMAG
ncbi:MAG: hypothetical protein AAFY15_14190, partial [Cyanobacteria bacterium J06648_11]